MEKTYSCEILLTGLQFPEGPVFDREGNLWIVETHGGNIAHWDGKNMERIPVDGMPAGAATDPEGKIWFCDSHRGEIRVYNPGSRKFETRCSQTTGGDSLKRPNDLVFDRSGNLLFSDHADGRDKPLSTVNVLPKGEKYARILSDGKFFTNGLAFGADGKTLIFAETYQQRLWIAEWDALHLELRYERPFARAGKGPWGPDGIAFDIEENLYVSVFNEGEIMVFDNCGVRVNSLPCPGSRPTNCAFDPLDRYGLVVTETEKGQLLMYPGVGKGLPLFYC